MRALSGYNQDVDLLLRVQDTGNGYIIKSPSYTCVEQDSYICMTYDEATNLKAVLNMVDFDK